MSGGVKGMGRIGTDKGPREGETWGAVRTQDIISSDHRGGKGQGLASGNGAPAVSTAPLFPASD